MLMNDFFYLKDLQFDEENSKITAGLEINFEHRIFEGHFPGNPIVPGVCMVEIVKETLEYVFNCNLFLLQSKNIKFLSVLTPAGKSLFLEVIIEGDIDSGRLSIATTILSPSKTFFKMNSVFSIF